MESAFLAASAGFLGLLGLGAWDIGRRWIGLSASRPDPAEVEAFEIQELGRVQARVAVLEQTLKAGLDSMNAELADSKAERRSAASMRAAVKRWETEHDKDEPPDAETQEASAQEEFAALSDERQAELVEGAILARQQ